MPSFDLADYVPVNERLEQFRRDHPTWGLEATIKFDGNAVLARAVISDESGRTIAVGHAEEIRDVNPVNKTSAVENCETSAWGRALACAGYEVKRGVASREEMEKVSQARARTSKGKTRGSDPRDNEPEPGKVSQIRRATDEDVARHPANGPVLRGDQAIAALAAKLGLDDQTRIDVIRAVTAGAYQSGKELNAEQVTKAMRNLRWLADGFVQLDYDPDGIPSLRDTTPSNPGPSNPRQRVDG